MSYGPGRLSRPSLDLFSEHRGRFIDWIVLNLRVVRTERGCVLLRMMDIRGMWDMIYGQLYLSNEHVIINKNRTLYQL